MFNCGRLPECLNLANLHVDKFSNLNLFFFSHRMETSGPASALDALKKVSRFETAYFVDYLYICALDLMPVVMDLTIYSNLT